MKHVRIGTREGRHRLLAVGAMAAPMLALAACTPTSPTAPPYETVRLEAEKLVGARVAADTTASAASSLWMVSNGSATGAVTGPVASTWFEVRARGDQCDGAPLMTVRVDGRTLATTSVTAKTWTT